MHEPVRVCASRHTHTQLKLPPISHSCGGRQALKGIDVLPEGDQTDLRGKSAALKEVFARFRARGRRMVSRAKTGAFH